MNSKWFILVTLIVATNSCGDFYWKDYDGKIPWDAIPAGKHSNEITYIGQAYIHNFGLMLGTIFPGQLEITVPCYGVKKTNAIIKILCTKDAKSNVPKFRWLKTTSATYQKDTAGKCPVVGGFDQKVPENLKLPLGTLHVGRTHSHGNVIIGNIGAYITDHPRFYYPLNDVEMNTEDFEVLVESSGHVHSHHKKR